MYTCPCHFFYYYETLRYILLRLNMYLFHALVFYRQPIHHHNTNHRHKSFFPCHDAYLHNSNRNILFSLIPWRSPNDRFHTRQKGLLCKNLYNFHQMKQVSVLHHHVFHHSSNFRGICHHLNKDTHHIRSTYHFPILRHNESHRNRCTHRDRFFYRLPMLHDKYHSQTQSCLKQHCTG